MIPATTRTSAVVTFRARPALGVAYPVPASRQVGQGGRFVAPCPACRRPLQIRAAYAGKALQCKRCGHRFVPEGPRPAPAAGRADLFASIATVLVEAALRDHAPRPLPAGEGPTRAVA